MKYSRKLFTSDLIIISNKLPPNIDSVITELSYQILPYSKFFKNNLLLDPIKVDQLVNRISTLSNTPKNYIEDFIHYDSIVDFTGLLKGFFIQLLDKELLPFTDSYLINFGGDILARNYPKVKIMNQDSIRTPIILSGDFICFTSGNNYKRGNHIKSKDGSFNKLTSTVVTKIMNPVLADIVATKSVANHPYKFDGFTIYTTEVVE